MKPKSSKSHFSSTATDALITVKKKQWEKVEENGIAFNDVTKFIKMKNMLSISFIRLE